MMGDRIEINFTANIKEFLEGSENITGELEETRKKLLDLADTSTTTYAEMTDAQKEAFKDQYNTTESFTRASNKLVISQIRAQEEAYRQFGEAGQTSVEQVTDAQGDLAKKSGDVGSALSDVGQIAKDALGGDVAGAADGALSTIARLAGAAGGLIGTAVVGGAEVVKGIVSIINENAQAAEARVSAMYDNFLESGINYLTNDQAAQQLKELIDSGGTDIFAGQAERLGVSIETVFAAQIKSGEERNEVIARARELLEDVNTRLATATGPEFTQLQGEAFGLGKIVEQYQALNGEQNEAAQRADLYRSVMEQITGQAALTTEEIQKANKALAETPKTVPVKLEVDSTALERALAVPRQINVTVNGYSGRDGQKVI